MGEAGRYLLRPWSDDRTRRVARRTPPAPAREGQPVVLVPGFLAGDGSLGLLARRLRSEGYRTYRSQIRANVGLHGRRFRAARAAAGVGRRPPREQGPGRRAQPRRHARARPRRTPARPGLRASSRWAARCSRPAAHHASLTRSVELLVRLSRAGLPGLMAEDCVAGACARASFDEAGRRCPRASPSPRSTPSATASSTGGPASTRWREPVEVTASHTGMAFDPRVADVVLRLAPPSASPGLRAVSARSRRRRRRVASRAGGRW